VRTQRWRTPWVGGGVSARAPGVQELAVGVVSKEGEYRLIDSGPLPEAVAASAAIPFIFNPVNIPGARAVPRRRPRSRARPSTVSRPAPAGPAAAPGR